MATWSDTPARARIIEFVGKVTTPGTDDFVPPDARIATFDMDGTVLTEKPVSIQTIIAMHQACVFGSNEPRRTDLAPFKQACARDYAYFSEIGMYRVLRDVGAGQTQARFRKYAGKALELARHPMSGRPLGAMVYAPMIELARYLQRHQFQVFLVSGSSQALVRKLGEMRFNLPRHQGIGTEWPLEFDPNPEGAPVFRWKAGPLRDPGTFDAGKPLAILRQIGQPPIFAAGNSMGDAQMLVYATKRRRPGMGILIVHDDAAREYAYSDPKIEAAALANGWSLVSMKRDFRVVFPD